MTNQDQIQTLNPLYLIHSREKEKDSQMHHFASAITFRDAPTRTLRIGMQQNTR